MYATKEQVAEAFNAGKIDLDTFAAEITRLSRSPFRLDVGEKGWLKINFDGFRFPVNIAYEQAQELFSEDGVRRVREFLKDNRNRFKVKVA